MCVHMYIVHKSNFIVMNMLISQSTIFYICTYFSEKQFSFGFFQFFFSIFYPFLQIMDVPKRISQWSKFYEKIKWWLELLSLEMLVLFQGSKLWSKSSPFFWAKNWAFLQNNVKIKMEVFCTKKNNVKIQFFGENFLKL
jgi:hypothetical protein